jgi:hypothetical protein
MESLLEEKARFRQEVAEFRRVKKRLPRRVEELERRVQELLCALEEPPRAGKRQAAPFSRRWPKAHPAKPGRKAGANYGCRCHRPLAAGIDETLEAELPGCCPHCGGEVAETKMERQYQTEIPPSRVEQIEFGIHVGRCKRCGRRVQGRHPPDLPTAIPLRSRIHPTTAPSAYATSPATEHAFYPLNRYL